VALWRGHYTLETLEDSRFYANDRACVDELLDGSATGAKGWGVKQYKSSAELEAMIVADLQAAGVDAQSIEVYRIDEPSLDMTWTIRKLRLNKVTDVKVESTLKRIVFALEQRFDLAP